MPGRKQVGSLWVLGVELSVLHFAHGLDHLWGVWLEGLSSHRGGNDGNGLNHLASELLVSFVVELHEVSSQEFNALLEVFGEVLLSSLSKGGESSNSVFLDNGDTVLDKGREFSNNDFHEWFNHMVLGSLEEVSESGTGMGLNSLDWVIENSDKRLDSHFVESILVISSHIIRDLTDAVACSVSNLWAVVG